MTGKELILYILQNNLENTIIIENGFFTGFMNAAEAAAKFGVGEATIRAWYSCKIIKGTQIGDSLYFRKDVADPRITIKMETGYEQ